MPRPLAASGGGAFGLWLETGRCRRTLAVPPLKTTPGRRRSKPSLRQTHALASPATHDVTEMPGEGLSDQGRGLVIRGGVSAFSHKLTGPSNTSSLFFSTYSTKLATSITPLQLPKTKNFGLTTTRLHRCTLMCQHSKPERSEHFLKLQPARGFLSVRSQHPKDPTLSISRRALPVFPRALPLGHVTSGRWTPLAQYSHTRR